MKLAAPMTVLVAFVFMATACNSYDPDLGAVPFRCGPDEPRCPLGYTCVSYSATEELCEKTGGTDSGDGGPGADAGEFVCANDGELEPNNDTDSATNTFIPSLQSQYKLVNLSICPDTDEDYFRFEVDVAGKNLRADLTYNSSVGQLHLEVLNGTGAQISQGAAVPGMPDQVRAEVANMAQGTYFVRVRAPAGIENNYTIEIIVSGA